MHTLRTMPDKLKRRARSATVPGAAAITLSLTLSSSAALAQAADNMTAPVLAPPPTVAPVGAPTASPAQGGWQEQAGMQPSTPPAGWVVMPPGFLETPGLWPRKIPYDEDRSAPFGYREGTEPRRGMWVTGLSIFASTYGLSALIGGAIVAEEEEAGGWLLLPVIGPMGFAAQDGLDDADDRRGFAAMTLLSGAQAAGLTLLIVGLATERKVFLRNDVASSGLSLTIAPTPSGAAVVGTF
jgi:hypothetical protein